MKNNYNNNNVHSAFQFQPQIRTFAINMVDEEDIPEEKMHSPRTPYGSVPDHSNICPSNTNNNNYNFNQRQQQQHFTYQQQYLYPASSQTTTKYHNHTNNMVKYFFILIIHSISFSCIQNFIINNLTLIIYKKKRAQILNQCNEQYLHRQLILHIHIIQQI